MARRYAPYLSFFSGNDVTSNTRRLSDDQLEQLIHVAQTINRLDLIIANNTASMCKNLDIHWERIDPDYDGGVFRGQERIYCHRFASAVEKRQASIPAMTTEESVVTYMSDHSEVSQWLQASSICTRLQIDSHANDIGLGSECIRQAQIVLNLGCELVHYLDPIQSELQVWYPDVMVASKQRLHAIRSFHVVANQPGQSSNPFSHQLKEFNKQTRAPSMAAGAYTSVNQSLQATLTATTLLILTLCLIPMVLAWQRSTPTKGTIEDADFWSFIQTTLMQLLSLFTMIFPISRFAPVAAWRYSWMFAVTAGLYALATPVLYVTVPVGWSGLVSYLASAAQAATVLQIMLGSNYVRTKIDAKKQ